MVRRLAPVPSVAAEVHGSGGAENRTDGVRAANACKVHGRDVRPFGTDDRAEQPTAESERAAASYVDWSSSPPSQRPLAAQRPLLATILFGVLKDHRVSRLRFADMIGVNEKQVRKMLDGRAPIPLASLGVMPVDMAIDFMDRIAIQRGVRRSFDAEVARMDLVTAIAAQGRLQAHVAKLAAGRGGR